MAIDEKPKQTLDPYQQCVHCGLCLTACPTYQESGNEANSPRGRLALWRADHSGRIVDYAVMDAYTDACVGCLACLTACPANVPYDDLLEKAKKEQRTRVRLSLKLKLIAIVCGRPKLFYFLMAPARWLKQTSKQNRTAVNQNKVTASVDQETIFFRPSCLTNALYREVSQAAINLLTLQGYDVRIPEPACCGALHRHLGLEPPKVSKEKPCYTDAAGCALQIKKNTSEGGDVLSLLAQRSLPEPLRKLEADKLFLDVPCHKKHGLCEPEYPEALLSVLGVPWEYVPVSHCCGAGGTYSLQHPDLSRKMIDEKGAFLHSTSGRVAVLTSNVICLRQWQQYVNRSGLAHRVQVTHLIVAIHHCLL